MRRLITLIWIMLPAMAFASVNQQHMSSDAYYEFSKKRSAIQLGPRPYYLVDDMDAGPLKETLQACSKIKRFRKSDFSIGHRGAPMQFPEHTRESYEAAARMGAGILECDVTFTQDKELVCRHSQCDLHTTTNILETELAQQCSEPFKPATFDENGNLLEPASAKCCTSDISLEQFKTLKGKMDAFNPKAKTVAEYLDGTANWRTDLYASRGTLMTHRESIQLFKKLRVKMTPELKSPSVSMPFDGFSQEDYAQKLINEYREEGVSARKVWPQSFNQKDVEYWIDNNPRFGRQAVFLDDRYGNPDFNHRDPKTWSPSMEELANRGVQIIAPPMWMLLDVENGKVVPSLYAHAAREAGLDIITWTVERSGPLTNGGGWYYQTLNGQNPPEGSSQSVINNDGDMMTVIDVLAMEVGVLGIFSDWPATTSYYANCMGI
ncbi:glycerophosphodiester phosphodiesterase family protein [Endozoicomonas arenosclerae]|uniref:glycerophosphodiester phosphodiesterase family protein n=1 Tax=Endozoicomonas arenosclerae TaxID=1633495 RepID=UPI0009A19337|nr:glycerophosphodiester phosphodiesterase family protein [Endozoicomonas arenosclerae]